MCFFPLKLISSSVDCFDYLYPSSADYDFSKNYLMAPLCTCFVLSFTFKTTNFLFFFFNFNNNIAIVTYVDLLTFF